MAEGYNHELLKSETQMREEIEQALGEALPYPLGSSPSGVRKHHAPAAIAD
jgi:hypothetical protein